MQKAQVSGVQFLKPGEYPAIVLQLMKHSTRWRSRYRWVIAAGSFRFERGGMRSHAQGQDVLAKLLGVISFISQHLLSSVTGDQFLCLGDVVPLPSGQDESQGVAQAVHEGITWILVLNPPRLRPRAWQACPPFLGAPPPRMGAPEPPCCQ